MNERLISSKKENREKSSLMRELRVKSISTSVRRIFRENSNTLSIEAELGERKNIHELSRRKISST